VHSVCRNREIEGGARIKGGRCVLRNGRGDFLKSCIDGGWGRVPPHLSQGVQGKTIMSRTKTGSEGDRRRGATVKIITNRGQLLNGTIKYQGMVPG